MPIDIMWATLKREPLKIPRHNTRRRNKLLSFTLLFADLSVEMRTAEQNEVPDSQDVISRSVAKDSLGRVCRSSRWRCNRRPWLSVLSSWRFNERRQKRLLLRHGFTLPISHGTSLCRWKSVVCVSGIGLRPWLNAVLRAFKRDGSGHGIYTKVVKCPSLNITGIL